LTLSFTIKRFQRHTESFEKRTVVFGVPFDVTAFTAQAQGLDQRRFGGLLNIETQFSAVWTLRICYT
jgi:hypothetical protein